MYSLFASKNRQTLALRTAVRERAVNNQAAVKTAKTFTPADPGSVLPRTLAVTMIGRFPNEALFLFPSMKISTSVATSFNAPVPAPHPSAYPSANAYPQSSNHPLRNNRPATGFPLRNGLGDASPKTCRSFYSTRDRTRQSGSVRFDTVRPDNCTPRQLHSQTTAHPCFWTPGNRTGMAPKNRCLTSTEQARRNSITNDGCTSGVHGSPDAMPFRLKGTWWSTMAHQRWTGSLGGSCFQQVFSAELSVRAPP